MRGVEVNRRKFGGKEYSTEFGLNESDFEARRFVPVWGGFSQPDPKAIDYPHFSPWAYCAGDPVNIIDPTGEDIVVLNYGSGTNQHMAILIQGDDDKWYYYSINGDNVTSSGSHIGGRPFDDIEIGSWETPRAFLNSPYNTERDNGKEDKAINNYGFQEGYQIPTTHKQDAIIREEFKKISNNTEYKLFSNNCTTAVQEALIKANVPVSPPHYENIFIPIPTPFGIIDVMTDTKIYYDICIIPSVAFKQIREANPNGKYYHK